MGRPLAFGEEALKQHLHEKVVLLSGTTPIAHTEPVSLAGILVQSRICRAENRSLVRDDLESVASVVIELQREYIGVFAEPAPTCDGKADSPRPPFSVELVGCIGHAQAITSANREPVEDQFDCPLVRIVVRYERHRGSIGDDTEVVGSRC